jgi:hypothetical protein
MLFDRCSALLLARERLFKNDISIADAAVVTHSIAMTQLAMGDAFLIAKQQHHWSCARRAQLLNAMSKPTWGLAMMGHHAQGVDFQLHPRFSAESTDSLRMRHEQVSELAGTVWLWLEQMRLKHCFDSVQSYARDRSSKFPKKQPLHNLMENARTFGRAGLISRWRLRHPQERLLRALPLLLWDPTEPSDRKLLASCFDVVGGVKDSAVEVYRNLWCRLNCGPPVHCGRHAGC